MATLERAIEIVVSAHRGQVDRANRPYILHPLEVMSRFEDETTMMVVVLHDTIEDSDFDADRLRDEGFSDAVGDGVVALTRTPGESYTDFVRRAAANPIARDGKLADIEHNLDVRRLESMNGKDLERVQKYHAARSLLLEA